MSILKDILSTVRHVLGLLDDDPRGVHITDVVGSGLAAVLNQAVGWNTAKGDDLEAQIRAAWADFDTRTGLEGCNVIPNLPLRVAESLFDHIQGVGLILSLWAVGYYGTKPELPEVKAMVAAMLEVLQPGASVPGSGSGGLAGEDDRSQALREVLAELKAIHASPESYTSKDQMDCIRELMILSIERVLAL